MARTAPSGSPGGGWGAEPRTRRALAPAECQCPNEWGLSLVGRVVVLDREAKAATTKVFSENHDAHPRVSIDSSQAKHPRTYEFSRTEGTHMVSKGSAAEESTHILASMSSESGRVNENE